MPKSTVYQTGQYLNDKADGWTIVAMVAAAVIAFTMTNPLKNRTTDPLPPPDALDQAR